MLALNISVRATIIIIIVSSTWVINFNFNYLTKNGLAWFISNQIESNRELVLWPCVCVNSNSYEWLSCHLCWVIECVSA